MSHEIHAVKAGKFTREKFVEFFKRNADLYVDFSRVAPDCHESRVILDRITEAGMWLRMLHEMTAPMSADVRLRDKKASHEKEN